MPPKVASVDSTSEAKADELYLSARGFHVRRKVSKGKINLREVVKALQCAEKLISQGRTVKNVVVNTPCGRKSPHPICDGCNGFIGFTCGHYTCTECDFDLCSTCFRVVSHTHALKFMINECGTQSALHFAQTKKFLERGEAPCGTILCRSDVEVSPDPGMVWQCNICHGAITTERFTCTVCDDFDMCFKCLRSNLHDHPLKHVGSVINRVIKEGAGEVKMESVSSQVISLKREVSVAIPLERVEHICRVDSFEQSNFDWVLKNRCTGIIGLTSQKQAVVLVSQSALLQKMEHYSRETSRVFAYFPLRQGANWTCVDQGTEITYEFLACCPVADSIVFRLRDVPRGFGPITPPCVDVMPSLNEKMHCSQFSDGRMTPISRVMTICDPRCSKRFSLGPARLQKRWSTVLTDDDYFVNTAEPVSDGSIGAPLFSCVDSTWVGVAVGNTSNFGCGLHIPSSDFVRHLQAAGVTLECGASAGFLKLETSIATSATTSDSHYSKSLGPDLFEDLSTA